ELNDPYRTAITLRYYDCLKPGEIAAHLNLPVGTVHTHLKRGLDRLRQKLDDRHGGDRRAWTSALAPLAGLKLGAQTAPIAAAASLLPGAFIMSLKWKIGLVLFAVACATLSVVWFLDDETEKYPDILNGLHVTAGYEDEAPSTNEPGQVPSEEGLIGKTTMVESHMLNARLEGRIVSRSDGSPIENAQVVVQPLPNEAMDSPQEGVSDLSGDFSISMPLDKDRKVESIDLRIEASGFKVLETAFPCAGLTDRIDLGVLYLVTNPVYEIRILDSSHQPIAGAEMKLYPPDTNVPYLEKIADEQGKVRISDQEVEKKVWRYHTNIIQVSAAGWSDYYREIDADDDPPFPQEIILKPESCWTGRVVDGETLAGLKGVEVIMSPRCIKSFRDPIGLRSCITDGAGCFSIPCFEFYRKLHSRLVVRFANLQVSLEGYVAKRYLISEHQEVPNTLKMDRAPVLFKVILVHEMTKERLSEMAVCVDLNYLSQRMVTDEQGCLSIPVKGERKAAFSIRALGYETYRADLYPETFGDDPYLVELSPLKEHRFEFLVRDDLGRPLSGARIALSKKANGEEIGLRSGLTDRAGKLALSTAVKEDTEIRIACTRMGYYSNKPLSVTVGEDRSTCHTITMNQGVLYQNICVLNDRGKPVEGADVVVRMTMNDDTEAVVDVFTNDTGFADLSLPPFENGLVYVYQREDIAERITFADVLAGKKINLILKGGTQRAGTIRGVVMDEDDQPLDRIWLECSQEKNPEGTAKYFMTNKDGVFEIQVFFDALYRIRFSHPWSVNYGEGVCYLADDLTGLRAGADLDVVMTRCPCLRIDLETLKERYDRKLEYEFVVENEDGWILKTKEILRVHSNVYFLDPPSGKVRIVITKPTQGFKTRSNLIVLEEGKVVEGSPICWE
ncbi:MAG: hypothetical protein KJ645_12470, partial [Planctomycetes bacterium]|nr:hypothetical protein [Planctomycetota bacterium]